METATSPDRRPTPRAPAMLSPVPAATGVPGGQAELPGGVPGEHAGLVPGPEHGREGGAQSTSAVDQRQEVEPVARPRRATSSRFPRRRPGR